MSNISTFSSYLKAASQTPKSEAEQNLGHVGRDVAIRYRNISYESYLQKYNEENWSNRKISAIPSALYAGLIKTVYHFSGFIFQGMLQFCSQNNDLWKLHAYHIKHDLQESLGWIITLFSDRLGSYWVEDSLFHQACYDIYQARELDRSFRGEEERVNADIWVLPPTAQYSDEDNRMTLEDFARASDLEKAALMEKFHLQTFIDQCNARDRETSFIDRLGLATLEILELVRLSDLSEASLNPQNEDANEDAMDYIDIVLSPTEDIIGSPLEFLRNRTPQQIELIRQIISRTRLLAVIDSPNLSIKSFSRMTGSQINSIIDNIPPEAFGLLSNNQIESMDLYNISTSQINHLFGFLWNRDLTIVRFDAFPIDKLNDILPKLPSEILSLIPRDKLIHLSNIISLTQEQLGALLGNRYNRDIGDRISSIPGRLLAIILPKLPENIRNRISPLTNLDLDSFSGEELSDILPAIPSQLLNQIRTIPVEKYSKLTNINRLRQDQLEKLMSWDGTNFRHLSKDEQRKIIPRLTDDMLGSIPNELLGDIPDLANWTKDRFRRLVCLVNTDIESRINSIPIDVLVRMIKNIPEHFLAYISDRALTKIDISDWSNSEISALFPSFIPNTEDIIPLQNRFKCIEKQLKQRAAELPKNLLRCIPYETLNEWIDYLNTAQLVSLVKSASDKEQRTRMAIIADKLIDRITELSGEIIAQIPAEKLAKINAEIVEKWGMRHFIDLIQHCSYEKTKIFFKDIDPLLLTQALPKIAKMEHSARILSCIPNTKLTEIDMTAIDSNENQRYRSIWKFFYVMDKKKTESRLDAISDQQLTKILPDLTKVNQYGDLSDMSSLFRGFPIITFIPNNKLKNIDITALETSALHLLFDRLDTEKGRERFRCIPLEQQVAIAPKLTGKLVTYIPNDRLADLFPLVMSNNPTAWESLFSDNETSEKINNRMSCLSEDLQKEITTAKTKEVEAKKSAVHLNLWKKVLLGTSSSTPT